MTGIIKKWVGKDHNHLALSWELTGMRIIRIGFVWRPNHNSDWKPVIQAEGQLLPLDLTVGLSYAIRRVVRYHRDVGTIGDPRFLRRHEATE